LSTGKDFNDILKLMNQRTQKKEEKEKKKVVQEQVQTVEPKKETVVSVPKAESNIQVPLQYLNIFKRWATVLKEDIENIKSAAIEIFNGITEDINNDLKWKRVISKLRMKYSSSGYASKGTVATFKGFICAVSPLTDFYNIAKHIALEYEKEHGLQETINIGLMDADRNILDNRETIFGSRPNPNYGKPLKANYRLVLGGFASYIDEDNYKWFTLELTGKNPSKFKYGVHVKAFAPCIFTAIDRTTDKDINYVLRSCKDTYVKGFQPYPGEDIDVETILANHEYVKISSLETIAARLEASKDYTTIIGLEVTVSGTTPNFTRLGQRMFFIEDETLDINERAILVTQDSELPYNVSKHARIYLFGRPFIMRGENSGIGFNSYGVYPIHVFKSEDTGTEEQADMFVTWSGD